MPAKETNELVEPIIDNIILDESTAIILNDGSHSEAVLFSSLKADAKPIKPYGIQVTGVEYTPQYSGKCAICNSPHRKLLDNVYIHSGKNVNAVLKFFVDHYAARLNWAQVKQHLRYHGDFTAVDKPGMVDYEGEDEMISRWKYREHELALTAMLVEFTQKINEREKQNAEKIHTQGRTRKSKNIRRNRTAKNRTAKSSRGKA